MKSQPCRLAIPPCRNPWRLGLIRQALTARNDPRQVVVDKHARYFGAELGERSLIPADDARFGEIRFQEWLEQPALPAR